MAKRGIFNNPIAPDKNKTGKLSTSISRDQMDSSGMFNLGCNYGSGYRNPQGTNRVSEKSPIPTGVIIEKPPTLA